MVKEIIISERFILAELKKAKPIINKIIMANRDDVVVEKILLNSSMSSINTIALLLVIGRDAEEKNVTQLFENPLKEIIEWENLLGCYYCDTKALEIDYILGKREYKSHIVTAVKLLSI